VAETKLGRRKSKVKKREVIEPEYSLSSFELLYAANTSPFMVIFFGKITVSSDLIIVL
tara:strand:+ start:1210 stop:1383 length:174 start_codon:yes stop_codon:yes gene_type:complete